MSQPMEPITERIKAKYTPDQIREAVLNCVYDSAMNDGDYLYNLLTWAHRDYTDTDYLDDFISMDLMERA